MPMPDHLDLRKRINLLTKPLVKIARRRHLPGHLSSYAPLDPGTNCIFTSIFGVSFGTPGCAAMPKASYCAAVPFRAP